MERDDVTKVLEAMRVPPMRRVYVLGCFERRVTIYSQQVRALNLVDALFAGEELRTGAKLAIIGGGIAGLTAAAGAARRGATVTVLERGAQLMPLFRKQPKRWLHPFVYDWPEPHWDRDDAGLPVMDWKADTVARVVEQLEQAWTLEGKDVEILCSASDARITSQEKAVSVTWNRTLDGGRVKPEGRPFDIAVLAIGFGLEESDLPSYRSYWENDDLDNTDWFDPDKEKPRRWLVSGCGDGALTDLLRLRIEDFRHERMVEDFVRDPRISEWIEKIREIEASPNARGSGEDARKYVQEAYEKIEAPFVVQRIKLRQDTEVTLNAPTPYYFQRESSVLNRFLVAQLRHAGGFRFVPGKVLPSTQKEGDGVRVDLEGGHAEVFDRVVFRHGPKPALERYFPEVWKACNATRQKWQEAPHLLDQTRTRYWEEGVFGPEARTAAPPSSQPAKAADPAKTIDAPRIVLASGARLDLDAHRKAVSDALARAGAIVIDMDDLGPQTKRKIDLAQERIEGADALVVLAGHRYAWLPPETEGGDGRRSMPWLEVDLARGLGKPVLAFVVDPEAPWSERKEQDLLMELSDEGEAALVLRRVQALKMFKAELEKQGTTLFRDPGDLSRKVLEQFEHWKKARFAGVIGRRVRRSWEPRVEHPLQPAPHFRGREVQLTLLKSWWNDPASPDRVVSLVAVGGTGKTALAEQLLREVLGQPRPAGTLIWSFYENPDTSAFLREACLYFTGEAGEAGGRLGRLKAALRDGAPHLLVLDGLERVQAEGGGGRARGELEDPALRQFLRSSAAGLGRARTLITSRFRVADLEAWRGAGYRAEQLDDLDAAAARAVLRAWQVQGDDAQLDELAESVGRHALSISVLGSYLANFADGDPTRAPRLDVEIASAESPEAARLLRLLQDYANALSTEERHLMTRLSMFPRGVGVELLGTLVDAGGQVAGVLVGCGRVRLVQLLERLVRLGLVFGYGKQNDRTYTAHPFLRDYFREHADVDAKDVHEIVISTLSRGLEQRPGNPPKDTKMLDQYEKIFEHMLLAERTREAFHLYQDAIGNYSHLGHILGDYVRGSRMTRALATATKHPAHGSQLRPAQHVYLLNDLALFASVLGDHETAIRTTNESIIGHIKFNNAANISISYQNYAFLQVQLGHLTKAQIGAQEAVQWAEAGNEDLQRACSEGCVAAIKGLAGHTSEALTHFDKATQILGESLNGLVGAWEAEFRWHLGDGSVRMQCISNLDTCQRKEMNRDLARVHTLLGQLALPDDPEESRRYLALARAWVERTGDIEVQLRAHRLASDLAFHTGDLSTAVTEAEEGLRHAETYGCGLYAIDLGLALARAHLARLDAQAALAQARQALDRAADPECGYAWGEADAAHLAGIAHTRLGEAELARRRLTHAVEIRERIRHPGREESRAALAQLDSA